LLILLLLFLLKLLLVATEAAKIIRTSSKILRAIRLADGFF
jgi:hypothetical protein